MSKPVQLQSPKKCNCCGQTHYYVPVVRKELRSNDGFAGLYWNCGCGSTLFAPFGTLLIGRAA